jgi:hypothetical protein
MFRFTIMFVWCFMMGTPHLGEGHPKNVTQDSLLPCPTPLILRMITPWGSNLHYSHLLFTLVYMFSTTPNCTNEPSVCVAFHRQGWVPTTFTKGSKGYFKVEFVWWQLQWLYLIFFHIWTYPPPLFSFTIYVYGWDFTT